MMIKIYLLNDMRTEKLGELETINPAASILSEICDDLNECSRAIARRQIPDIEPTKKVKNYRKPDNILIIFCYSTADKSSYRHSRSRVAWWDIFGWGIHPHHLFHSRGLRSHRETFGELLPTSTGSTRYCNQPSGSYSSKRNGDGKLIACFEK